MERLFTILSWTLLYVTCPEVRPKEIGMPTLPTWQVVAWYYTRWFYNVYVCSNNVDMWNVDPIIYHELWHLLWFMYMDKLWTRDEQELFAIEFSKSYIKNPKRLQWLIQKIVDKHNFLHKK